MMSVSSTALQDLIGQLFAVALPWLMILVLVSSVITLFKIFLSPKIKGRIGEASVNRLLRKKLDQNLYHLIPDIMLPAKNGTTQIDHVLVSCYGVFVIETKMYKGWIFGNEKDAKWTQQIYKHKSRFQNPLRQNYKHTKTLAELTGVPFEYFESVIMFVGDSTFKTAMPDNVIQREGLIEYITSFQTPIIQDQQVLKITQAIQAWSATLTPQQKADHVKNLKANH